MGFSSIFSTYHFSENPQSQGYRQFSFPLELIEVSSWMNIQLATNKHLIINVGGTI
jgi:hypothetical protein